MAMTRPVRNPSSRRVILAAAIAGAMLGAPVAPRAAAADWLQWGGAGRNFMPEAAGLASSWPPGGPKRLWTRPLGEGHSAILAEGGRIYTMYRPLQRSGERRGQDRGQEEVVLALDAASGKTAWEFTYPAPTGAQFGPEHMTPNGFHPHMYSPGQFAPYPTNGFGQ